MALSAHFIDRLRSILSSESTLISEEEKRPYETDGLTAYRQLPGAVLLPKNESEVQQILTLCVQYQVPIVPRGHGTGLSGGALPHAQGVLLSLSRLNRIIEINPIERWITVQPGVRNLAVSEAANPHGLYYAPDPSSQIACSIGGNVAENSGGVHCLKYGLTLHNLIRVRGLTVSGEVVELTNHGFEAGGYDLLALITGSEGLLLVVTEVTLKLLPKPVTAQVIMATFTSVEQAGEAVAKIIASGLIPAGLEMMDGSAIRAAEAFVQAQYPTDAEALLLCEVDGWPMAVAEEMDQLTMILNAAGAIELRISQTEAERLKLWAGRKAAFPAVGRLAPDYYCIDGTIPRRYLGQVLRSIYQLSEKYKLDVCNVFHAGDGNLHPLILFDGSIPGQLEKTEHFAGEILELCIKMGGTITGEHGVGIEKLDQMCSQFNAVEREIFLGLKAAFDPQGLLNPGKAIPSLHRCAELGKMIVHHNHLPHPELPRF